MVTIKSNVLFIIIFRSCEPPQVSFLLEDVTHLRIRVVEDGVAGVVAAHLDAELHQPERDTAHGQL